MFAAIVLALGPRPRGPCGGRRCPRPHRGRCGGAGRSGRRPGAARHLAAANGGELVGYRAIGDDVVVDVAVGGVTARARARRGPRTVKVGDDITPS